MKFVFFFLITLVASFSHAAELRVLSPTELKAKLVEVTDVQNKVMMLGSTVADVDALFSLYTKDFVYVHEVYGGVYTREDLYKNTVRLLERGKYAMTEPRYTIVSMIPGHNGIAVEREQISKGEAKKHLAVFEFREDKISKITEYWK